MTLSAFALADSKLIRTAFDAPEFVFELKITAIADGDFGGFIQTPHPRRAGRAPRNSADNYYPLSRFH